MDCTYFNRIYIFYRKTSKCPMWSCYLLCVAKALHTMIKKPPKSTLQQTTKAFTEVKHGFESIPKWGHSGCKVLAEKKKNLCFRLYIMSSVTVMRLVCTAFVYGVTHIEQIRVERSCSQILTTHICTKP